MTVNYGLNELNRDSGDSYTPLKRVIPRLIQAKTFAAGTGTLALLTPMSYHTGLKQWVPFQSTGSSGETLITGFVWPDAVVLNPTLPVLGQMLMAGEIHHDDIPVLAGETQVTTDAALASGPRTLDLIIQGLPKFR